MITQHLLQLKQVENLAGIVPETAEMMFPYKRFDKVWIRADKSLDQVYTKSLKHSELQFYPSSNYRAWGVWLLTFLKLKKGNQTISKLLGIGFNWLFAKRIYFPVQADIIYYRKHTVVSIYTSLKNKKVIKMALTSNGIASMKAEIQSQRIANTIKSEEVYVPKIIMESVSNDLIFSVVEFFVGRKQSFMNRNGLKTNYRKAYKFLLNLYLLNPIELQRTSQSQFLNHDFVEEYILSIDQGEMLLSLFKKLDSKQKYLILCRIHGDLNHHNLLSNKGKLCIIDWAESKHYYISVDMENSSYNTEAVFEEFVARAQLDKNELYSYHEQLYLAGFIGMSRLIYLGLTRKMTDGIKKFINSKNQRLVEMSKQL